MDIYLSIYIDIDIFMRLWTGGFLGLDAGSAGGGGGGGEEEDTTADGG